MVLHQIYDSLKDPKASELILSIGNDFWLSFLQWNLLENATDTASETCWFYHWLSLEIQVPYILSTLRRRILTFILVLKSFHDTVAMKCFFFLSPLKTGGGPCIPKEIPIRRMVVTKHSGRLRASCRTQPESIFPC